MPVLQTKIDCTFVFLSCEISLKNIYNIFIVSRVEIGHSQALKFLNEIL